MNKVYAVVENNKVVNIISNPDEELVMSNLEKYVEYTNGWNYNNGIDGGEFFPIQIQEEPTE
jgi:hypothetical protein